jgi:predicted Rossmann fold flavoprotein
MEASVSLMEKMPRPGLKLLASGAGQCNISHSGPIRDFLSKYNDKGRFLKHSLLSFSNEGLLDFFRERGIEFEVDGDSGKIFPSSRKASAILESLLRECELSGVRLETGQALASIEALAGGGFRCLFKKGPSGDGAWLEADAVLLALGGASYPRTGSSGDGYAMARSLGHSVIEPRPALVGVKIESFPLAGLSGLSFREAGLRSWRGDEKTIDARGDLLITHQGFSGPLILDSSRDIKVGDRIRVDFTRPGEDLEARLDGLIAQSPKSLARGLLFRAGLPKSLSAALASLAGIGESDSCAALPRQKRRALAELARAFPAMVGRLGDFDEAMVTAGGVERAEIEPRTMESRIRPGLFFCGEIIDVDGDSGGYNLQAAFSTGETAARGMAGRLGLASDSHGQGR